MYGRLAKAYAGPMQEQLQREGTGECRWGRRSCPRAASSLRSLLMAGTGPIGRLVHPPKPDQIRKAVSENCELGAPA